MSHLEEALARQLLLCGIRGFQREYRFAPPRKWRFDFAWPDDLLAVECEGAIWTQGRHTRGSGYSADLEKYNQATLQGWRVLRYSLDMIESGQALREIETALGLIREANDAIPF